MGRSDAASHHQQAPGGDVSAVAQRAQHIQSVPGLPAGKPFGALAPNLKDHPQEIFLPVADGDGAAEQTGVTALDMDKLAAGDLLRPSPPPRPA
ncbi:MAG: hypothetical protein ACLSAF_01795 [Intestinimonas sp.]